MNLKKIITVIISAGLLGIAGLATYLIVITSNLPQMITIEDYKPLLVSQVYDRNGNQIGEFFREKRILVEYEDIPKHIINAFVAAEDDTFFEHGGINYQAILRAVIANIKAGRKRQGGSTITQQVARSLLLTREKTYTRKIKEVILSYRMEANLSKEEILWLYLNQIYLGQGAYGVAAATNIYFRKELKDITVAEAALLAGLPQAPSRYSPIYNPSKAKARQRYVLSRMAEEEFVPQEEAAAEAERPLQVYVRKNYKELAPFYLETVRLLLVKHLGESQVLDKGIKVYTSLDLDKQKAAKESIEAGLRSLDKRQGYRGALQNLEDAEAIAKVLKETRDKALDDQSPVRILQPDGTIPEKGPLNLSGVDEAGEPLPNVPPYLNIDDVVKGVVTNVDDKWGLVTVRFAESRGLIDIETMKWARKPNPNVRSEYDEIDKPSDALKKGDVIEARLVSKTFRSSRLKKELNDLKSKYKDKNKNKKNKEPWERPEELPEFDKFTGLELEQEPVTEAALIAFDQGSDDVISLVGGSDFSKSQFNRALQAARQTGSAFKSIVYASALDKGYTPATPIIDAPIVFEEDQNSEENEGQEGEELLTANNDSNTEGEEEEVKTKRWKPMNHSHKFSGDILFRNALIRSLNVPTVKILEKISIDWVAAYARRLGIFSPLNMDFSMALGSSGVTLYEVTKVFSHFSRMGKRIRPRIIHKVESKEGEVLLENLSLDDRFEKEITQLDEELEERRQAYLKFKRKYPELAKKKLGTREKASAEKNDEMADTAETNSSEAAEKTDAPPENTEPELDENGEPIFAFNKKTFLKEPPLYFDNPEQLIDPKTAYITASLLRSAVEEPRGTGGRARELGRPVGGKTGTTNGYFDGWFVGFTADISTGVWVGFDNEKTLGRGEVGGKAALPIWLEYMKFAHEGMPERDFPVPDGIVFANIDNDNGKLASASSEQVVKQAFAEGTEPSETSKDVDVQEEQNFFKEEMAE